MLLGSDFTVLESGTFSSNKHCSCMAIVQLKIVFLEAVTLRKNVVV